MQLGMQYEIKRNKLKRLKDICLILFSLIFVTITIFNKRNALIKGFRNISIIYFIYIHALQCQLISFSNN